MSLLADYAITPDVFDTNSYSSEEVCRLRLSRIRRVMMEEGLVRDLRAGEWRRLYTDTGRKWHRRAGEVVRKLATHGRLIEFPSELTTATNDREWCAEALATHEREPMKGGVIVTRPVKDKFPRKRVVERIDLLTRASWWTRRSTSVRLDRKLSDYEDHLRLLLRHANSLQFIDPHLNPRRRGYRDFVKLLTANDRRRRPPHIEIHRVQYVGSGANRDFPNFEPIFRRALTHDLRHAGLSATVFIWDDFHDRYLISNLIGISLANGFDTTGKPDDITTWTRLGRVDRDDVQREFDEAARRHRLCKKFTVP